MALAKEAALFLKKAQAQADAAAADPENAKELADDLDTKVRPLLDSARLPRLHGARHRANVATCANVAA